MDRKHKPTKTENVQALKDYPGVAVNQADGDKDTVKLEKERTCTLNNNPRNNEIKG